MFEDAWCKTCTVVTVELEMFDERNICKLSSLWEAIHDLANFNKYYVVNKEMFNMFFINEKLGGNPSWYPQVFILIHISVEVKVLDFQA